MDTRYLNEVAQQLRKLDESSEKFGKLSRDEQLSVLRTLEFMAHQANSTPGDVPAAVARAKAEQGFRPAWIPDDSPIHLETDQHYEKCKPADLLIQYRYLMALYSLADERRRIQCAGKCNH